MAHSSGYKQRDGLGRRGEMLCAEGWRVVRAFRSANDEHFRGPASWRVRQRALQFAGGPVHPPLHRRWPRASGDERPLPQTCRQVVVPCHSTWSTSPPVLYPDHLRVVPVWGKEGRRCSGVGRGACGNTRRSALTRSVRRAHRRTRRLPKRRHLTGRLMKPFLPTDIPRPQQGQCVRDRTPDVAQNGICDRM
jgi:hypothetical protein